MRKAPPQIDPPKWDKADAYAIQALMRGGATEEQQRRAIGWIINLAAGTYDMSFNPDNASLTAFAEGRRFVGNQIVKLGKLDTSKLTQQQGG